MRLSEINKIVTNNIEALTLASENIGNGAFRVGNIIKISDAVNNLSCIKCLEPAILSVKSHESIYSSRIAQINIQQGDLVSFQNSLMSLRAQCETIQRLALSILPPEQDNTLCVKVSNTTNVSDLLKLIQNLEIAFSQASGLEKYNGHIKFSGVEAGSSWIYFVVDNAECLGLLCLLTKVAYKVVRDYIQLKKLNETYRAMKIINDASSTLESILKDFSKTRIETLLNSPDLELKPDEVERAILCATKLAETIYTGNKITALLPVKPEEKEKLDALSERVEEDLKMLPPPSQERESVPDPLTEDTQVTPE